MNVAVPYAAGDVPEVVVVADTNLLNLRYRFQVPLLVEGVDGTDSVSGSPRSPRCFHELVQPIRFVVQVDDDLPAWVPHVRIRQQQTVPKPLPLQNGLLRVHLLGWYIHQPAGAQHRFTPHLRCQRLPQVHPHMEPLRPGPLDPSLHTEPAQQPVQVAGVNEVGLTLVEVDSQPVHIPLGGALVVLPKERVHPDGRFPLQVLTHSVHIGLPLSGVRLPLGVDQGTDAVIVGGYTATLM